MRDLLRKVDQMLCGGRVMVTSVAGDFIAAYVVGDHALYRVTHDPEGWDCSCASWSCYCSHVRAVQSVTLAAPAIRSRLKARAR